MEKPADKKRTSSMGHRDTEIPRRHIPGMPSIFGRAPHPSPFLNKLFNMVSEPKTDALIRWSEDGQSFIVNRQEDFAREVLPQYFKHNKFSSFVRQLNMYDFHKIPHITQGVLENNGTEEQWEFSNPHFQRYRPDLLLDATRKRTSGTGKEETDVHKEAPDQMQAILQEVATLKHHQLAIGADLKSIQAENSALWGELINTRDKYTRQQDTITRILNFLASVYSNDKNKGGKLSSTRGSKRKLLDYQPESETDDDRMWTTESVHNGSFQNSPQLPKDEITSLALAGQPRSVSWSKSGGVTRTNQTMTKGRSISSTDNLSNVHSTMLSRNNTVQNLSDQVSAIQDSIDNITENLGMNDLTDLDALLKQYTLQMDDDDNITDTDGSISTIQQMQQQQQQQQQMSIISQPVPFSPHQLLAPGENVVLGQSETDMSNDTLMSLFETPLTIPSNLLSQLNSNDVLGVQNPYL